MISKRLLAGPVQPYHALNVATADHAQTEVGYVSQSLSNPDSPEIYRPFMTCLRESLSPPRRAPTKAKILGAYWQDSLPCASLQLYRLPEARSRPTRPAERPRPSGVEYLSGCQCELLDKRGTRMGEGAAVGSPSYKTRPRSRHPNAGRQSLGLNERGR